jgi:hypothetical protein
MKLKQFNGIPPADILVGGIFVVLKHKYFVLKSIKSYAFTIMGI